MAKSISSLSKFCPKRATKFYLNPAPAVGAIIIKRSQVLLSRRKNSPYKHYWDLPGGFLNPEETPEQALKREIREELDVEIKIGNLIGFFPDTYGQQGTPTLNIFFYADIKKGEPKPASDIDQIKWFCLKKLPKKLAFKNTKEVLKIVYQHYHAISVYCE